MTVLHIKKFLDHETQCRIVDTISELDPGFYTPKTKWGNSMHLKINCLGRHWSALSYKYMATREDFDKRTCAAIPEYFQEIARSAMLQYMKPNEYRPFDICIVNWYDEANGKLGLHQDNSESALTLASGYPVVSLSIGSSAEFMIGGLDRKDVCDSIMLESGDALIFGRSKRLAFHGIKKLIPGTAPEHMTPGRYNLTFRLY